MYRKLQSIFFRYYLMLIPMSIIFQSCLGSIAAYFILEATKASAFGMLQLSIPVLTCMFYNASILAQINKRIVFQLLLLSLTSSGLIILIYLLL